MVGLLLFFVLVPHFGSKVLARWSKIVIAANCVLVIPGWSVVAEIRASGWAVGSVTAKLS